MAEFKMNIIVFIGLLVCALALGTFISENRGHWKMWETLTPSTCAQIVCETHGFQKYGTIGTQNKRWTDMSIIECYNESDLNATVIRHELG